VFRRILITALLAGFLGGVVISVVQAFTTTPIILHAEKYENQSGTGHDHSGLQTARTPRLMLVHETAPAAGSGAEEPWAPADGIERTFYTALANVLTGVGFALVLVACFALSGRRVDGREGVLWGVAGFAIVGLAPALGLPPEVPGAMAAELGARQAWWFLCVALTAGGLWMLVFRSGVAWIAGGIVLIALPHLIGAPRPENIGGPVPPELAGHFAAASLVTAAIFWCVTGWLSGTFWKRFSAEA